MDAAACSLKFSVAVPINLVEKEAQMFYQLNGQIYEIQTEENYRKALSAIEKGEQVIPEQMGAKPVDTVPFEGKVLELDTMTPDAARTLREYLIESEPYGTFI